MPSSPAHAVLAPVRTDLQLRSVLVATDFTPTSEKAVRYAAAIARRYGSKFYLLHVVSALGFTLAGPDALSAATDLARRDVRQLEEKLVHNGRLRDVEHEIIVCSGDIWPEVERIVEEERIEMLVIGTHSRHGLGRLVLGSVAEQIFRHASCPVLTVGPHAPAQADDIVSDTFRPILFATDFSDESLVALPYAISYANRRNTRLVLLHMLSPVPHVEGSRWYTASDVVHMQTDAESATQTRLLELVSKSTLAMEPICVAHLGSAVEGIVKTAHALHALGIVLGLKPHGEAISHMPWSTAYQIVCEADCPVLTVRNTSEPEYQIVNGNAPRAQ